MLNPDTHFQLDSFKVKILNANKCMFVIYNHIETVKIPSTDNLNPVCKPADIHLTHVLTL